MTERTLIIAEAGVNHNGSINLAKKMIDAATRAGADVVKFQTFKAENLLCKTAPKAEYQRVSINEQESQFEIIKRLEFDINDHRALMEYAQKNRVIFLSTPFDLESIDLLDSLGIKTFKIPSGEITNLPYLRKLGALNKQLILSTGMADLCEIGAALKVLTDSGTPIESITVLHCNTEYPTPYEDVNLKAMLTIKHAFPGVAVGYSDHTLGIEVPIAAVAMGATVIEKHFTLDRKLPGPDHRASLEPDELSAMVTGIRHIEKALGTGIKKPSPSEMKNKPVVRKSIVAASPIQKGELFSENNITVKRPGTCVSPMRWDEVIGRKARKDYQKDDQI